MLCIDLSSFSYTICVDPFMISYAFCIDRKFIEFTVLTLGTLEIVMDFWVCYQLLTMRATFYRCFPFALVVLLLWFLFGLVVPVANDTFEIPVPRINLLAHSFGHAGLVRKCTQELVSRRKGGYKWLCKSCKGGWLTGPWKRTCTWSITQHRWKACGCHTEHFPVLWR